MDPVSALGAAAVAFLTPYLAKAGEKTAERIGEKLPEAVGKMWTAITGRLKGRPAAEEAVKDLVAQPEDEDNVAAFRKELRKVMAEDPAFASELRDLLQQAKSGEGDTILNTGSGAVANRGGAAAGEGGAAVQGNVQGSVNIGNSSKKE